MNRRAVLAVAILVAWLGGVGMLVRREYFRPHIDRLAEAALRVTPDAVFYAVMQGDRQVGFASSTIDTATAEIEQRDYLVADMLVGGSIHRAEVRTNVILTRTLRLKSFDMEYDAGRTPVKVTGRVDGDSLLVLAIARGTGAQPDTQRVPLSGPMLMPTLVPLALALDDRLDVGSSITFPVFDQATLRPRNVRLDVRAESLFVVNDSSVYDSATGLWNAALPDTVRGWHVVSQSGGGIDGWVDEHGRLIASNQLGFHLRQLPYEVAFENWQLSDTTRLAPTAAATAPRTNVVHTTLLAAGVSLSTPPARFMRATVVGPVAGLELTGGRQQRRSDTVIVTREPPFDLVADYRPIRLRFQRAANPDLKAEPGIEVDHPEIMRLAYALIKGFWKPEAVVRRYHEWIGDSVTTAAADSGSASALRVLRTRRGDEAGITNLFVALARAAGVPARVVTGVVYHDGRFYHHRWAEVLLGAWVAVDPTFDQFPASANHLRLHYGAPARANELERLLGDVRLRVVNSQ